FIFLKVSDLYLTMSRFRCFEKGSKERIVPLGHGAKDALEMYLQKSRPILAKRRKDESVLFLNQHGRPLSRQGFWKLLKSTAREVNITKNITQHTLRDSFAKIEKDLKKELFRLVMLLKTLWKCIYKNHDLF